jgi:hypothetical protein
MITTLAVMMLLAQDEAPLPPAPMVESTEELTPFSPRFRFEVGSFTGVNTFQNAGSAHIPMNTGMLGGTLRPGIQLTDRFGLEVEGSYSTTWFFSTMQAGVLGDFTVNDHLSLALGGVYGNNVSRTLTWLSSPVPDTNRDYAAAVERVDFHWFGSRGKHGARKAFSVGVELEEGAALPDGFPAQAGVGGYLTMGFRYW